MDPDLETFKFKLLLVVAVAFIVSIFLTWTEARYYFFSKTLDAVVAQKQTFVHRDRYGHESRTIDVSYTYLLNGASTRYTTSVAEDFPLPAVGGPIKIQSLGAKARILGSGSILGPLIFLACLTTLIALAIPIWRESRNDR